MPKPIKSGFWPFYLQGREDRIIKNDLDEAALVDAMLKQPSAGLYETALAACEEAVRVASTERKKRSWITLSLSEDPKYKGPGGASYAEDAYDAYLRGRLDKLVHAVQKEMFVLLQEHLDWLEDDEDEEDDDEAGAADDEDDDDDDEEEED